MLAVWYVGVYVEGGGEREDGGLQADLWALILWKFGIVCVCGIRWVCCVVYWMYCMVLWVLIVYMM